MTQEVFDKACKLKDEIKRIKRILKAFNSPSENVIRCNAYNGEKDVTEFMYLSNEPELEMKIREYLMHKLDVLEQKFAELN